MALTTMCGFVADLDKQDLMRLREITRKAYSEVHPKAVRLTDAVCDYYIEELGPDAAVKTLRRAVDSKAI
jgi:hypothetical protein